MWNIEQRKSKCTKQNPSTCRIHGPEIREKREFLRELKENSKKLEFTQKAAQDFKNSWKITTDKNGNQHVTVYRSGIPTPPTERGVEKTVYEQCDLFKPEGHNNRMEAVFAAPTLGGAARWVIGNSYTNIEDIKVRELKINIDTTYIYSVQEWEKASSKAEFYPQEKEQIFTNYWNTGITMREYMEKAQQNPHLYDPTEWELLIPENNIVSVKPVSKKRVAENSYGDNEERILQYLQ